MRKTTYCKGEVVKFKENSYRVLKVYTDGPKDIYLIDKLIYLDVDKENYNTFNSGVMVTASELSKDYIGDVLYGKRSKR